MFQHCALFSSEVQKNLDCKIDFCEEVVVLGLQKLRSLQFRFVARHGQLHEEVGKCLGQKKCHLHHSCPKAQPCNELPRCSLSTSEGSVRELAEIKGCVGTSICFGRPMLSRVAKSSIVSKTWLPASSHPTLNHGSNRVSKVPVCPHISQTNCLKHWYFGGIPDPLRQIGHGCYWILEDAFRIMRPR